MATSAAIKMNIVSPNRRITRVLTVADGVNIWQGTLVGKNVNGEAIKANSSDFCIGVAENSRKPGSEVVCSFDHIVRFSCPGVAADDIGKTVYAVDNDTVTLSPNPAIVGQIINAYPATGLCDIHCSLAIANRDDSGGQLSHVSTIASGRYDSPGLYYHNKLSNGNLTPDRIYALKIFIKETRIFDRISIDMTSAGAAGKLGRLGIYDEVDSLPGNLVLDAGQMDLSGSGVKEIVIYQQLTPGFYWITFLMNSVGGTEAFRRYSRSEAPIIIGCSDPGGTHSTLGVYRDYTYGALPDPFGTATYAVNEHMIRILLRYV